jgi:hypothetical protein
MAIFQPTDLNNCFIWYNAAAINTVNNGLVTYWQDSSGSGNHLTVVTSGAASTPVYLTNFLNNYPVVGFNGNSILQSNTSTSLNLPPSGLSLFSVFNVLTDNQQTIISNLRTGTIPIGNIRYNFLSALNLNGIPSGFTFQTDLGNENTPIIVGTGTNKNVWSLRCDRFDARNSYVMSNYNVPLVSGGMVMNNSSANRIRVGNEWFNSPLSGYIAEIIGFSRILSNNELIQVNDYLKAKYNLSGSNNTTLFMVGTASPTGSMYSSIPLYAYNNPIQGSGVNLYTLSSQSSSSGMKLYTGSSQTISSGKSLYIGASTSISGGNTMYTSASTSVFNNIVMYEAGGQETKTAPMYIVSIAQSSNSTSLYIGSSSTISSGKPLYITGKDSTFVTSTLYTMSSAQASTGVKLYIGSSTPINSSSPLYLNARLLANIGANMYMVGGTESNNNTLFTRGMSSISGSPSLYISSSVSATNSFGLITAGRGYRGEGMNMFAQQLMAETGNNSMTLFMSAPSIMGATGLCRFMSLYTSSFGVRDSMPMFLKNTGNPPIESGFMPMYLKTNEIVNTSYGSVMSFVMNNTVITGRKLKLYIRGDGQMDGASIENANMNMFLKQNQGDSQSVALVLGGKTIETLSASLFTKGVLTYNSGTTLVISGQGVSGTVPLYVSAGGSSGSGVSLYTYTKPSIDNNTSLYTYGF